MGAHAAAATSIRPHARQVSTLFSGRTAENMADKTKGSLEGVRNSYYIGAVVVWYIGFVGLGALAIL